MHASNETSRDIHSTSLLTMMPNTSSCTASAVPFMITFRPMTFAKPRVDSASSQEGYAVMKVSCSLNPSHILSSQSVAWYPASQLGHVCTDVMFRFSPRKAPLGGHF